MRFVVIAGFPLRLHKGCRLEEKKRILKNLQQHRGVGRVLGVLRGGVNVTVHGLRGSGFRGCGFTANPPAIRRAGLNL
jgi:hypothetical protein